MFEFVSLSVEKDHARVLDLCHHAADYIVLETGKQPDLEYVKTTLTEAPPKLGREDVFALGIARPDGTLAGMTTYLRHFYQRDEWYMGLMLLDPCERGQKLGQKAANHVFDHARSDGGTLMRIAVLDANPRGRRFWESLGFLHERTVPAAQNDDGHERHILRKTL